MRTIAKHCPHLVNLVLANCPLITDVAMSEIATNLSAVRSVLSYKLRSINEISALSNVAVFSGDSVFLISEVIFFIKVSRCVWLCKGNGPWRQSAGSLV